MFEKRRTKWNSGKHWLIQLEGIVMKKWRSFFHLDCSISFLSSCLQLCCLVFYLFILCKVRSRFSQAPLVLIGRFVEYTGVMKTVMKTTAILATVQNSDMSLASKRSDTSLQMVGCTVRFWLSTVVTLNTARTCVRSPKMKLQYNREEVIDKLKTIFSQRSMTAFSKLDPAELLKK